MKLVTMELFHLLMHTDIKQLAVVIFSEKAYFTYSVP